MSEENRPMSQKVQEYLEEIEESALTLDGFEEAIIGITEVLSNYHVVYSRTKCIEVLIARGMTHEEAEDFFCYNTERAIPYMSGSGPVPLIMHDLADY